MKPNRELLANVGLCLISLSKEKDPLVSQEHFLTLIGNIKLLGPYNSEQWYWEDVQKWWSLFETVSGLPHISSLLSILDDEIAKADIKTLEPLEFMRIELTAHSPCFESVLRSNIEELIKKYPNNVEFLNTYAHMLVDEMSSIEDIELGIMLYKAYVERTSSSDDNNVVWSVYNSELMLYQKFRELDDDVNAEKVLDRMSEYKPFEESKDLWNTFADVLHVHDNMKIVTKRIQSIADKYQEDSIQMAKESTSKTFEQLVIFTAIITFVITAAGSTVQSSLPLWGITGLGMTLLIFVLTIQLGLEKPTWSMLKTDFRFYSLISAFVLTSILTVVATFEKVEIRFGCIYNCNYDVKLPDIFELIKPEENNNIHPPLNY